MPIILCCGCTNGSFEYSLLMNEFNKEHPDFMVLAFQESKTNIMEKYRAAEKNIDNLKTKEWISIFYGVDTTSLNEHKVLRRLNNSFDKVICNFTFEGDPTKDRDWIPRNKSRLSKTLRSVKQFLSPEKEAQIEITLPTTKPHILCTVEEAIECKEEEKEELKLIVEKREIFKEKYPNFYSAKSKSRHSDIIHILKIGHPTQNNADLLYKQALREAKEEVEKDTYDFTPSNFDFQLQPEIAMSESSYRSESLPSLQLTPASTPELSNSIFEPPLYPPSPISSTNITITTYSSSKSSYFRCGLCDTIFGDLTEFDRHYNVVHMAGSF